MAKKPSDDQQGEKGTGATRQAAIRFPVDLHARIERVGEALGLDVSSVVRMIIAEHIREYERRADRVSGDD